MSGCRLDVCQRSQADQSVFDARERILFVFGPVRVEAFVPEQRVEQLGRRCALVGPGRGLLDGADRHAQTLDEGNEALSVD